MVAVVLLAPTTSYRQADFVAAAERLGLRVGVELILATDRCPVLAADYTEEATGSVCIELRPPERAVAALVELHKRRPFAAIVPVDDATTVIAAQAAAALGLVHNELAATLAARDKRGLRERLQGAGVPQPRYRVLPLDAPPAVLVAAAVAVGFPCVLKPVMLSASQGVIRADDEAALLQARARIRALLRRPAIHGKQGAAAEVLLCESFVPGPEVAVEAMLRDGELTVLALFDKPDPLDGPFFEETIYVTPSRLPPAQQQAIARTTAAAARALGLRHGPLHAELRLSPAPVVIEVAARSIGGLCSRTLRFGTGRSLEELILLHSLGLPLAAEEVHREQAAAGVMMLPIPQAGVLRATRGLQRAQAVPGIVEVTVTARPGEELVPLPEGGAYLGFLFARGATPAAVEAALRAAHRELEFVITKTLQTADAPPE